MIIVYTLYLLALLAFVGLNLKYSMPKVCALGWAASMVGLGCFYEVPYIEFLISIMAFPAFLLFSPKTFFFLSATYELTVGSTLVLTAMVFLFAWAWFELMLRVRKQMPFLVALVAFPPLALVLWIPALFGWPMRLENPVFKGGQRTPPLKTVFEEAGQGHVFEKWDKLTAAQQAILLKQVSDIDLEEIKRLEPQVKAHKYGGKSMALGHISPPNYIPHKKSLKEESDWLDTLAIGDQAIRDGQVGLFTVAGGQGTRLGVDGPKGLFPITPIKNKSLFQVFAEKIKAAETRYECVLHWFIMTSPMGYQQVETFFKDNQYFGLEHVHILQQGCMPAVDMDGKILMQKPYMLAMSPDGHGGAFRALVRHGCTGLMRKYGIKTLSYFQVDNPLVKVLDPHFIGFHCAQKSEMSSKMALKRSPEEKVGLFCHVPGNKLTVVEYSDMPEQFTQAIEEDGSLRFRCANLGIHLLDLDFIEKVGSGKTDMPLHLAHKKVPYENGYGDWVEPTKPNAIKFEMFIFDALKEASNPVLLEAVREEEFSPVKNAQGQDSPMSCQKDQQRLFGQWFKVAGVDLDLDADGCPNVPVEISPLFAINEEEFIVSWEALEDKPDLNQPIYLG